MRLGSIISLKNGRPCQSYGFKKYRGLGQLNTILRAHSEKEIDEIAILNIDREAAAHSHAICFEKINGLYVSTPILYGGGGENIIDDLCKSSGIERFILSSLLIEKKFEQLEKLSVSRGVQSLVGCFPVFDYHAGTYSVLNSVENTLTDYSTKDLMEASEYVDEILIIDCRSYGIKTEFSWRLTDNIQDLHKKLIISGGISDNVIKEARIRGLAAVYFDNSFLHSVKMRKDYEEM